MKKTFTFLTITFLYAVVSAQTVSVTFTGRDAQNQYLPLNRVVVSNLTEGWQETLTWPDTVLVMTTTGIGDVETQNIASLQLSQNNPNPFDGTTFVNLNVVEQGDVTVEITDIAGRIVGANHYSPLQPGPHSLHITLSSPGLYFLTARQNGQTVSVKMVNRGNGSSNAVAFAGIVGANHYSPLPQPKHAHRGATDNPFDPGDQMEYVGFAMQNGTEVESGHVVQLQESSQTVVLTFGGGAVVDEKSCPGTPTVTDHEGNVYATVQIGQQCWTRENLRTTHYADGTAIPAGGSNMSGTEPYYYDYSSQSLPLESRGYLYNWSAAMHGVSSSSANSSGVQGICPAGWHLPSDAEWTQLTDYVGGQSEFTCGGNSSYIAKALASIGGWTTSDNDCSPGNDPSANNTSGFGAVPAGGRWSYGFDNAGNYATFWSSTGGENASSGAYSRCLFYYGPLVSRLYYDKGRGFSVRCLRD